jgi:hypothetical protein
MPTNNRCEVCHVTTVWAPVPTNKVSHLDVTGSCSGCHVSPNTFGVKTFKNAVTHIPTSMLCDNCHDAPPAGAAWRVIVVDHTQVSTNCVTCHTSPNSYGVQTYRSASHIPTTTNCTACHFSGPPKLWKPVRTVNHNEFLGSPLCSSCHDGVKAKGKGTNHFKYTGLECNKCHTTTAWSPQTYLTHSSNLFFTGHWFGDNACTTCHKQNSATITTINPAYKSCAACHANKFKPGDHKGNPINGVAPLNYEKCDGTCHKTTPQHRVNAKGF